MDEEVWHIPPVAMDLGRLEALKMAVVPIMRSKDRFPTVSAVGVHELLCHLAAREEAIAGLLTQIEEMYEKHKTYVLKLAGEQAQETRDLVALHSQTVDALNDTIQKLRDGLIRQDRRMSELQAKLDRSGDANKPSIFDTF